jgi:uncharacterized protein YndB with AHSA1/START domain
MSSDESIETGPLAEVAVEPDGDRWRLIFTRTLRHPPERVWAALTDPQQLPAWAPFTADRPLDRVGDIVLTMIDGEKREDMPSTVLRVEPPHLLEHTWDTDLLRWELRPAPPGTRLTLRHTIAERSWVPKVAAGWHLCLVVAERLLDGDPVGPVTGEAAAEHGWAELRDGYADRLEIRAVD